MISLLSPAKKLNFEKINRNCEASQPIFEDQASSLARTAAKLNAEELAKLMKISMTLAELNKERFDNFVKQPSFVDTKQAAFAFAGDTYIGLNVNKIDPKNDSFFQNNVRILSGLYGLLRPFDLIKPYRLEMGSKLKTAKAKNLYDFWNNSLVKRLETELTEHKNKSIINLASDEYFKALNIDNSTLSVITPKFLEVKNGEHKLISFYAKKARGLMARFIVNNKIIKPEDVKEFDFEGYKYEKSEDDGKTLIFYREQQL